MRRRAMLIYRAPAGSYAGCCATQRAPRSRKYELMMMFSTALSFITFHTFTRHYAEDILF